MEYSVDDFIQCLESHETATLALNHWCAGKLPGALSLHAQVLQDVAIPPQAHDGQLVTAPEETLRHRRVCLNWGNTTVSEADNWYLPDRLPRAMREQLERSTVPFGQVVMDLRPVRTRISQTKEEPGEGGSSRFILHVTALMCMADGTPIAEVREHYRRELLCLARTGAY